MSVFKCTYVSVYACVCLHKSLGVCVSVHVVFHCCVSLATHQLITLMLSDRVVQVQLLFHLVWAECA